MREAGRARDVEAADQCMSETVVAGARRLRVGVRVAEASARLVAEELARRRRDHPAVADLISYRIGPSVGAHTGPGTAGAVYHELD